MRAGRVNAGHEAGAHSAESFVNSGKLTCAAGQPVCAGDDEVIGIVVAGRLENPLDERTNERPGRSADDQVLTADLSPKASCDLPTLPPLRGQAGPVSLTVIWDAARTSKDDGSLLAVSL